MKSAFHKILIGIDRHEPCPKATSQHAGLRPSGYHDIKLYATLIGLLCQSVTVCFRMSANFFFGSYFAPCFLRQYNAHWSKIPRENFQLRVGYSRDTAINERQSKNYVNGKALD